MIEVHAEGGRLLISGELLIRSAEEFKAALWESLEQPGETSLDLSGVEDVDIAGLQVLLSFLITKSSDSKIGIASLSPALERALPLTGLMDQFAKYLA